MLGTKSSITSMEENANETKTANETVRVFMVYANSMDYTHSNTILNTGDQMKQLTNKDRAFLLLSVGFNAGILVAIMLMTWFAKQLAT